MRKYIVLIAKNLGIAVAAVVLYSPGLLALRITDYNIFRAVMSVTAGVALVLALVLVNYRALAQPKHAHVDVLEVKGISGAGEILKEYQDEKFFGNTARTAMEQLERTKRSRKRLEDMLERKFTRGSLSWEKFSGITRSAEVSIVKNVVLMANRMSIFDEKEYERLLHYKEDDIPDDIQVEQLKLYEKNLSNIKDSVALNEKILLKLDTLAMELSELEDSAVQSANTETLEEIEKLVSQTKYYQ